MVNVNDFKGQNDNERIENAIKNKDGDGIVIIPPRISETEPERHSYLLDRAILIPENTTIVLENCKIKLSDKCRDNFLEPPTADLALHTPKRFKMFI